jgi:hypothetical protein
MNAYRLVPKENAKDKASAETYVIIDSGGAAIPTGETIEITGGWKVGVYSTDGMATIPAAAGRSYFEVIAVNQNGTARLRDAVGYEFESPSTLPEFLGDDVVLQPGQRISAVAVGQTELRDVVVEDGLCERRQFDGERPSQRLSWTPGIATGPGFVKN